jgi:hypothetical protein
MVLGAVAAGTLPSCSSSEPAKAPTASFSFESLNTPEHFYDAPYPSDLRLTAAGTPDLTGMPYVLVSERASKGLFATAMQRKGFPTYGATYFKFDGAITPASVADAIPAGLDKSIFLVDVDANSKARGTAYPIVAQTLPHTGTEGDVDDWIPEGLFAVAPRPGIVLAPNTKYAVVIKRQYGAADKRTLSTNDSLQAVLRGEKVGTKGQALVDLYAPLVKLLGEKSIPVADVAAATVFTTGDVVKDTFDISEKVKAAYTVELRDLKLDSDDGNHAGYCEVLGKVTYPQFQAGKPPFATEGLFDLDANGLPKKQRDEEATVVLTIPKNTPMPANGFPVTFYFHGSGSPVNDIVDAAKKKTPEDEGPKGEGPAMILASKGFAGAASALPFSVDRIPGAREQEYLNLSNLQAFRDTFRQGMLEQRLFIDAVKKVKVTRAMVAGCDGVQFPAGKDEVSFDPKGIYAMGQSMGGAYTNYLSALDPDIKAAVPTGAGGFWSYFILKTTLIPNAQGVVTLAFLGFTTEMSFVHPALNLLATAWEPADPLVYTNRVSNRPLAGHAARPVYEPAGKGDRYFPIDVYDAMALAYGHQQAGEEKWPGMQQALTLDGRGGILPYPVENNATNANGERYTGVVVQYEGDGIGDPHGIYRQLDAVKYQYGCFLESMQKTGVARVVAPAPLGTPCP